ncbi:hypothetical protein PHYC_00382 [Phycisphaerales bacterium]|nr:hypothetical protein PHYC_00382 [Phycisphaerales bacterium]
MAKGAKGRRAKAMPGRPLDRFDLYELCVQAPMLMARFLGAVHGRKPLVLREDFSGGGALCKAWVRAGIVLPQGGGAGSARRRGAPTPPRSAIAVDLDAAPLRRLKGFDRIHTIRADVRKVHDRADIIAALNFPLGYFYSRDELVHYLRLSRRRLNPRGVFVGDIYGGEGAFELCSKSRDLRGLAGEEIEYTWEQREADVVSGRVFNAIHFTVRNDGASKPRTVRDAFTYDWRLWSIPELTDAYHDAGFKAVEVYDQNAGAIDHLGNLHVRPVTDGRELEADWVVYVVGRK